MSEDRLFGKRLKKFRRGTCPNYGKGDLRGGPYGGLSQNIICVACGARYNNTSFGVDVLNEPSVGASTPADALTSAYREKEWIDYVPAVMVVVSLVAVVVFFIIAVWSLGRG